MSNDMRMFYHESVFLTMSHFWEKYKRT